MDGFVNWRSELDAEQLLNLMSTNRNTNIAKVQVQNNANIISCHPSYYLPPGAPPPPPHLLPLARINATASTLPSSFNPRDSPNMSHREKVSRWLNEIPFPDCRVSNSSARDNGQYYDGEDENVVGKDYDYDFDCTGESQEPFLEQEDILAFQAMKITHYVRKLYHLDKAETVVRGPTSGGLGNVKGNNNNVSNVKNNDSFGDSFSLNVGQRPTVMDQELEFDLLEEQYLK